MPLIKRAILPPGTPLRGFFRSDDVCFRAFPIDAWSEGAITITSVKAQATSLWTLRFFCHETRDLIEVIGLSPPQEFELRPWIMTCEAPDWHAVKLPTIYGSGDDAIVVYKGYCMQENLAVWHDLVRLVRHCIDSVLKFVANKMFTYLPGALFLAWTLVDGKLFTADFITITPLMSNLAERSSLTHEVHNAMIFDKVVDTRVQYRTCAGSSQDFELNLAYLPLAMAALYLL